MMIKAIDKCVVNLMEWTFGSNSTTFWWLHTYWEDAADPRIKGFTLVDVSHSTMALLMLLYTSLVWVIIPAFMRKRKPFDLKKALITYDFFMVFLNAYFFIKSVQLSNWGKELLKFYDTQGDNSEQAMRYIGVANLYYISKMIDMIDTFFMAFRKRNQQISFLHVWHHNSLVYAAWLYMKYNPYTPTILVIPFINTLVHVIMYGYYGCAALGPHMRPYLWWKKYITQIQLIQLSIVFAWYIFLYLKRTNLPTGYLMCNLCNSAFLFALFAHFYIQSYRAEANKKKT